MIPRTLVPTDVRPLAPGAEKKNGHRLTTYMADRPVVPPELSDAPPLDGKTSIPSHLPLGVLVDRTLVPRGMAVKPYENTRPLYEYVPLAIIDSRVVVPAYVETPAPGERKEFERTPQMTAQLREVIEPDIFMTGDANLLMEPEPGRDTKSDVFTQFTSVLVHIGLIIFVIFIPQIFPAHVPTTAEIELARNQLGLTYLRPYLGETSKAPAGPKPKVRIDKKTLNDAAPPRPEAHFPVPPSSPAPAPADLPSAPTPHTAVNPNPPSMPQPTTPAPSQLTPLPAPAPGKLNLQLPNASPGRAIQDQLSDAVKRSGGGGTYAQSGGIPRGAGSGGGGRGGPQVGNAVSILTPTEGVNFDSYITRLLAAIKRNWYTVMPESAMMGEKGIVFITFQINQDGSVPTPDPLLERTSGKDPLDTAAMSAIKSSNPFDPLPSQFHGPFIRLRIIFLYNLPLDYARAP
jgi:outer membrane biosynthesis protein TonB